MSNLSFLSVFRCWTVQLFQFLHLHWPGISSMIPVSQTWMLPHSAGYTKLESKKQPFNAQNRIPVTFRNGLWIPLTSWKLLLTCGQISTQNIKKTCLSKVKSSEVIRWGILVGKTGNKKSKISKFCISSEGFRKERTSGLLKVLEVPWSASRRFKKRQMKKRPFWTVSFDVYFQDLQEPRWWWWWWWWCALESFTTSFMKNLKCIMLEQEHVVLSTNSIEHVHLVH